MRDLACTVYQYQYTAYSLLQFSNIPIPSFRSFWELSKCLLFRSVGRILIIEPAEDFVDTDRQGDSLSDNIPAVFAVSFGSSLLANLLLGKGRDASANVPSQGIDIFNARQDVSYINA